jgi:hypothetical protein
MLSASNALLDLADRIMRKMNKVSDTWDGLGNYGKI